MKNKKKFIIWTLAISIVLVVVLIYSNVTKVKPLTYTYSPYKATSEVTGNYAKYLEDVEKYIADLDVNKDEDTTNDFKLNAELKTYFIDGTSYKEGSEIDVTTNKQELDEDGEYVDVEVKSKSTVSMGADTIAFGVDKATGVSAENAEFKTTESYANADGRHETQNLLLVNDRGQIIYETPEELVAGFYNIYIKYYSTSYKSTRSAVERNLKVVTPNGNINQSFDANLGAQSYVFSRNWGNDEFDTQTKLESDSDSFKWFTLNMPLDSNNNDIKPNQKEIPTYMGSYFKDDMGYVVEPYKYYLEGKSQLILSAIKEWMMIDYIVVEPVQEEQNYQEYLASIKADASKVNQATSEYAYRIEAEAATNTSSPTLYPVTDRTSSKTYPFSIKETKLNTIGGDSWKVLGDWVSWTFEVDKPGFYNISLRAKQNLVRGMYSTRIVYIDDVVPFEELNQAVFSYSSKWQLITLGASENEPYDIWLEPGKHTVKMEVTLGDYGVLVEEIQDVINDLNQLYLDIIKFTTTSPDASRDYDLAEKTELNLENRLIDARDRLTSASKDIEKISNSKSDKTGVIDTMVIQLEDFIKDCGRNQGNEIPGRISSFSTNVSSLGSLLLELREFPLAIDYLVVYAAEGGYELPKANESIFAKIWNGILGFIYSFIIDYSSIGSTTESQATQEIDVWMTLGRDQANVIRKLVDESFNSDIKVNIRLTGTDVLLKAALAGVGPDVAINVDSSLPVNYGLRGAALDLKQTFGTEFDDFVAANFQPSVMRQFTFTNRFYETEITNSKGEKIKVNPDGVYALPEKQIYMMMFVRTDIMATKFGSDLVNGKPRYEYYIPQTWDDVINIVADLQKDSLQFYLPVNDVGASSLSPIFVSLLYQTGGRLYINDNKESGLLEEVAMQAFEDWTNFYTLYSFPKFASFTNRFRSGEMPLGLSYYEMYNTLSVFAPEIRGNWDFYPIPGSERNLEVINKVDENGKALSTENVTLIDHTSTAIGTGAIILRNKNHDPYAKDNKEIYGNAWEFVKWWTSTDTQARFGQEMEGILGSAARHATANVNAFQQLAWPQDDLQVLLKQWNVVAESEKDTQNYYIVKDVNGKDQFYTADSGVEYQEIEKIYYYDDYDMEGNIVRHIYGVRELPQIAGSYITGREVENAYRKVINESLNAKETLYDYAQNINNEIDRKRTEFGLPLRGENDDENEE